jgi:hypothetical protein
MTSFEIENLSLWQIFNLRLASDQEPAMFQTNEDSPEFAFFIETINETLIIKSRFNDFIQKYSTFSPEKRLYILKLLILFSKSCPPFVPSKILYSEADPFCCLACLMAEYILNKSLNSQNILYFFKTFDNESRLLDLAHLIITTDNPKTIENLVFFINAPSDQAREKGVEYLKNLNTFRMRLLIGKLSVSDNILKRKTAFSCIALFPHKSFLPIVLKGLSENNIFLKNQAQKALEALSKIDYSAALILKNQSTFSNISNPNIWDLSENVVLKNLESMLFADDMDVKKWAFAELKELFTKNQNPKIPLLVLRAFQKEKNSSLKSAMASFTASTAIYKFIPVFIRLARSKDPETIILAIKCLAEFNDSDIKDVLESFSSHDNEAVRDAAYKALARLEPRFVIKEIPGSADSAINPPKAGGLLAKLAKSKNNPLSIAASGNVNSLHAGGINRTLISNSLCASIKRDIVSCENPYELIKAFNNNNKKYQLIEEIGKGGMGRVFKALCTETQKSAAVKIMYPHLTKNPILIARFNREAEARFKHENIVEVIDSGSVLDNIFYIVMDFIEGKSLQDILYEKRRYPLYEGLDIIKQICSGFGHAHQAGCFHRDIKPENIIINTEGKPKITDFGLVKAVDSQSVTTTGTILGTPYYMPPEQAKGLEADQRSDIYSIGIIMFRMLTGYLPFKGNVPMEVAKMHVSCAIPDPCAINPDIPGPIKKIILKCTSKEPEERYENTGLIINDIQAFLESAEPADSADSADSADAGNTGDHAGPMFKNPLKKLLAKFKIKK